ncbi:MAG: hypothetical protein HOM11_13050, partial [Methylococcales bacterium]|nr:hypothetical protein [Methylococcales bacterium]
VLYSGGWQQNEIIWVSDYDAIYDGNAAWKADWKNQYYNALGQSAL